MSDKICPIMSRVVEQRLARNEHVAGHELFPVFCSEGGCAWWNSIKGECSMKSHGDAVDDWIKSK